MDIKQKDKAPPEVIDKAVEDFLRSLKVCLNDAIIYASEHPLFVKSVLGLKAKIEVLGSTVNPFRVGFTPDSIIIGGKNIHKSHYLDIAANLHRRKVKFIEIKKEVSAEELTIFVRKLSLPYKEILGQGGVKRMLLKEKVSGITVEELDYSQVMKNRGSEDKEIWPYLLYNVVESNDPNKVKQFSDNFDAFLRKMGMKEILNDERLKENMLKFLLSLKNNDQTDFKKCMKDTIKTIVNDQGLDAKQKIESADILMKGLGDESIADKLWEDVLRDDSFDPLSFKLFFQLIHEDRHKEIAQALAQKVQNEQSLRDNLNITRKIKELFSTSDDAFNPHISETYRNTLSFIMKDISTAGDMSFDREHIDKNYRIILLYLLGEEKKQERMGVIIGKINTIWDNMSLSKDSGYLEKLILILKDKKQQDPTIGKMLEDFDKRIAGAVEKMVFNMQDSPQVETLADYLQKSSVDANFYLNNMFMEDKVSPVILKLFFKLFPDKLESLNENLKERANDITTVSRFIDSLKKVDIPVTVEVLKYIYLFSNNLLKVEALKAMKELAFVDKVFLFSVLSRGAPMFKEYALAILSRDSRSFDEALNLLFSILSPFGFNNNLLIENISLVQELDIKQAKQYLVVLSKRMFFWNSNLREAALQALDKLGGQ